MFCRVCKVTAALLGAATAGLVIREVPGFVRELRAIRMANWRRG